MGVFVFCLQKLTNFERFTFSAAVAMAGYEMKNTHHMRYCPLFGSKGYLVCYVA